MRRLIYGIFITSLVLLSAINVFAQHERNHIYMVDATSALNKTENLWKNTRKWLEQDIRSLQEGRVTVIPFQEETLGATSFNTNEITENQTDGIITKYSTILNG